MPLTIAHELPQTSVGVRKRLDFVEASVRSSGSSSMIDVLEVGCGTGELLSVPLARRGFHVTGIDVHEASIERAREHARGVDIELSCERLEERIALGRRYSLVICSEVLEHLDAPGEMLRKLHEVTRSDGVLIVTVPNGYGAYEMSVRLHRWYQTSAIGPLYRRVKSVLRRDRHTDHAAPVGDVDECGGTLNHESGHVQFFTWTGLRRLFRENHWKIDRHEGRTLLCGPFLSRHIDGHARREELNASAASVLPTVVAADWMFALSRA
jgi:SAM-dependent methyltransferase